MAGGGRQRFRTGPPDHRSTPHKTQRTTHKTHTTQTQKRKNTKGPSNHNINAARPDSEQKINEAKQSYTKLKKLTKAKKAKQAKKSYF